MCDVQTRLVLTNSFTILQTERADDIVKPGNSRFQLSILGCFEDQVASQTIRVSKATRDITRNLAVKAGTTMAAIAEEAVKEYEKQKFWENYATVMNESPAGLLFVAPITGTDRGIMAHVRIPAQEAGLTKASVILTDQVRSISIRRLGRKPRRVFSSTTTEVEQRLALLLGLERKTSHPGAQACPPW